MVFETDSLINILYSQPINFIDIFNNLYSL